MPKSALFLDRDGVINVDRHYVHRIEDFEFSPGIFDLVRYTVHRLRWPVIVVTNQSGIGRGYYDEAALQVLTTFMCARFAAEGAPITHVYHCPYHPEHGIGRYRQDHPWRKPNPGMILQAASDFDLDLARSVFVGNSASDMQAAARAGIGSAIMLDPAGEAASSYIVVQDLAEALARLCSFVLTGQ